MPPHTVAAITDSNSVSVILQPTQDLSALVPAPFRNGQNPSGKPKAGDYAENVTKMINHACRQYEVLLATEDPYPSSSTAVSWAARTWTDVLHSSPSKYRLCSRIEKIITSRSSHARGALRDRVRPLIASSYGFVTDGSARAKQRNMVRYSYLLDSDSMAPELRFYYADLDKRQGFAKNPIILTMLKEHWFGSSDGAGIKYPVQFSPVREVTLALIFTTIEYCLDQWATGLWDKNITFANKAYHVKYQQHLRHIQEWGSLDLDSSRQIRQRMYDRARRASGAPPAALAPTGLSDGARERLRLDLAAQVAQASDDEAADPSGPAA
ncbi:hypothetical protein BN946_scf184596.g1 [Trametes cinnabarina]|uniref:DUF6532 domain-containing protein n=1 Tax=Pycnoporus cinnabarinus TaxID=5643 RepID=A0A060T0Q8_PYCCI|nr:hypothetical protein BN946_scf184596.g1 [Trametes cinnabarina]